MKLPNGFRNEPMYIWKRQDGARRKVDFDVVPKEKIVPRMPPEQGVWYGAYREIVLCRWLGPVGNLGNVG